MWWCLLQGRSAGPCAGPGRGPCRRRAPCARAGLTNGVITGGDRRYRSCGAGANPGAWMASPGRVARDRTRGVARRLDRPAVARGAVRRDTPGRRRHAGISDRPGACVRPPRRGRCTACGRFRAGPVHRCTPRSARHRCQWCVGVSDVDEATVTARAGPRPQAVPTTWARLHRQVVRAVDARRAPTRPSPSSWGPSRGPPLGVVFEARDGVQPGTNHILVVTTVSDSSGL
jgi:hypothetical protein